MSEKSDLEKAASAHASERCPGMDDGDIVWCMCREDFMEGFHHALQLAEEWCAIEVSEHVEWAGGQMKGPAGEYSCAQALLDFLKQHAEVKAK